MKTENAQPGAPADPGNFAVAVIVETPGGIPLVCDRTKPLPHYWKFPGGRSMPGEKPVQTAVRELFEETGIRVRQEQLALVREENRGKHSFFLFQVSVSETPALRARGGGGELVKLFPRKGIETMPDFFPSHHRYLSALEN